MAATSLVPPATTRIRPRTALIASADSCFRERLGTILSGLRWQVRQASGAAQAWGETMEAQPQTMIVDSWLPDLEVEEFVNDFHASFPNVEIVTNDGRKVVHTSDSAVQKEILYAMRRAEDVDVATWKSAPRLEKERMLENRELRGSHEVEDNTPPASQNSFRAEGKGQVQGSMPGGCFEKIPELIGDSACMLEVSRRIRRVATRNVPVLIEGPTGSGKELVAEAVHRLSSRSRKPMVAINCAAIPEALLESELFGHTRGAFTGAVHGRTGRIEAADGGTLFLDEIGELPLSLQAKLLRFVETGELQRIGDNEPVKVDVRIIAATHRPLAVQAQSGQFRADLYYRIAVFLIRTPALSDRVSDLSLLIDHFLSKMGSDMPVKRIDQSAFEKLREHAWPGNVRELCHVLARAAILADDEPIITAAEIEFGDALN